MAEPRARVYHRNRVAETLREEIGTMLEGQLSDPRIAFCYVTEVAMNPGSKSARVYIAVDGGEEAEKETVAALIAARGYIRHELLERMGMRRVPDLTFHVDKSEKFQSRIDELLGRTRKRQRAAAGAEGPLPGTRSETPGAAAPSSGAAAGAAVSPATSPATAK